MTCKYCNHEVLDFRAHFEQCPILNLLRASAESVVAANPQLADNDRPFRFCYGCTHMASCSSFPGHPSGESACMACVRNVEMAEGLKRFEDMQGRPWGRPVADNYISLDMFKVLIDQSRKSDV